MKSGRLGENIILVRVPGIEPRAPVLMFRLVKWVGGAHCRSAVFAFKECLCQSHLLLPLLAVVDVRMHAKGDPAYIPIPAHILDFVFNDLPFLYISILLLWLLY